jgi:hypothetical protein
MRQASFHSFPSRPPVARFPFTLVLATVPLAFAFSSCIQADRDRPDVDETWVLRSERSGFEETSSYPEVVELLERAAGAHPSLHLTRFGYSNEGRALPLLVAGPVSSADPAEVRAARVPVVYLQGNIHAGEVAGKEALLRLVRDLARGEHDGLLREMILLIGPVYNADGNERLDLRNRPRQHGPVAGMGTRPNAQGLDLNRDQMKLDSPEARSLAWLLTEFDPQVLVDLHTTNGTRHAYHLTYSPPLHPATPARIDALLRERLLPDVTGRIAERWGWHFWHYGNVSTRQGERGWFTFDHRPRFVTNYAGLRNRIGILSEAYSYATFEDRVLASERFVEEILDWIRRHPDEVRAAVTEEDARDLRGSSLPLRAGFPSQAPTHAILMGDVEEEVHPWTGQVILRRLEVVNEDAMPAYVAFTGTEHERVPHEYFVSEALTPVLDRLRAHGVRLDQAPAPGGEGLQTFRTVTVQRSQQPFQGRNEVTVEGTWEDATPAAPSGTWWRIPMDQPLARLAFLLIEPRADDGLLNWGIMDPWLEDGGTYPILRRVLEPDEEREPSADHG